jgi:RNA polymerase sigma factor (sigma-70 family)
MTSNESAGALILVVDDDDSVRHGLDRLLRSAGFSVQTFPSADAFFERAPLASSDAACLLLDVRLPGGGLVLQERLRGLGVHLPIIFISGWADVTTSVRAMKGGAIDYLLKPVTAEDLLPAVEAAVQRARQDRSRAAEVQALRQRLARLTPRERQVMQLVVLGLSNKQVAAELGASERTIKIHRGRVMRKMSANSLPELVLFASRLVFDLPTISYSSST